MGEGGEEVSDEPGVGGDFLSRLGPGIGKGEAILNDISQSQRPSLHHLIQMTILPQTQIWSLHSMLKVPGASSHPRREVLVPLWALQWP